MTKAQSFFGGTNPKRTGEPGKRVGNSSATSGVNNITSNHTQHRDKGAGGYSLRPAITRSSSGGKTSNSQMVRQGKTSEFSHRPNLSGKVDNRKVGQ